MRVYTVKEINYAGEQKERGEVFELIGLRNDSLLMKHGYLNEHKLEKGNRVADLPGCDGCAKKFESESYLYMHYEGRIHPQSPEYEGPQARYQGEQPVAEVRTLLTGKGKNAPIYQE